MDWPIPYKRQAGGGQPEPEGVNCSPREAPSTKLQAGFIANQDFLGFWMVDIVTARDSSPEETHGTPEKVRQLYTQKTEWQRRGRQ